MNAYVYMCMYVCIYIYLCSLSQRVEVKEVIVPDLVLLPHKVQAGSEHVRLGVLVGDACMRRYVYICYSTYSIYKYWYGKQRAMLV